MKKIELSVHGIIVTDNQINQIESKIISTLGWDLSKFPIKKEDSLVFKTDRDK